MQDFAKTTITNVYDEVNSDIEYWKQYVRSESMSMLSDVWTDAQDEFEEFMEDWK